MGRRAEEECQPSAGVLRSYTNEQFGLDSGAISRLLEASKPWILSNWTLLFSLGCPRSTWMISAQ